MTLENFDRQYRVLVECPGGAFEFGGEEFPLHISFSFQKTDNFSPNTGALSVWNLNEEHINMLIEGEENSRLALWAGYGDRLFQIFSGVVVFSSTSMDGGDRRTDIDVMDTLEEQRDTYSAKTFAPGTNWRDIIDECAATLGIPVEYGDGVEFKNIDTGFSFMGLTQDIFTKGCESNGLSWSVQDGIVYIRRTAEPQTMSWVYEISPATGMIEMPVRTCVAGSYETGDKIVGYDVTLLLNGDMRVDGYVHLKSKYAEGDFYIKTIEHTGDSMGGSWQTKLRLLEPGRDNGVAS